VKRFAAKKLGEDDFSEEAKSSNKKSLENNQKYSKF
jgi:hypothetical protein